MLIASTGDSYVYPYLRVKRNGPENEYHPPVQGELVLTSTQEAPMESTTYPSHLYTIAYSNFLPYAYYYFEFVYNRTGSPNEYTTTQFSVTSDDASIYYSGVNQISRAWTSGQWYVFCSNISGTFTFGNPNEYAMAGNYVREGTLTLNIYQAQLLY